MRKIFLFFSMLLVFSSALKAQTRTVSGVVTGDKGETLPGVTIKVKGSSVGTQTDIDGKYSIKVTSLQNVTIGATYIGYAYQEKVLKVGEMNADFKLASSTTDLNEVVVVGYGEQKKIHLTGAVATINMRNIEDIPSTNLSEAIKGQLPNIGVSGGDTRPGQSGNITIRNPQFGSASANTLPLYVIDDAFRTQADFNLLDQSEIESISFLKDAAAAIYGVQGANGAVIVRTKHGKAGAPKVTYSGTRGLSTGTLPKMMTGLQQATYLNDLNQTNNNYNLNSLGINTVTSAKVAGYYTPDELAYIGDPANNTDFLRQAWQTAVVDRHALTVTGGTDKATFYAGANYVNQTSNFSGVNTDRWGYRASADVKVANNLKVGVNLSGNIYKSKSFFFKTSGESLDDDVGTLSKIPQFFKMYIDGNPVLLTPGSGASKDNINFFELQKTGDYTASNNYLVNIDLNAKWSVPFIKGLDLSSTYNRNVNNFFGKQYGSDHVFYQYSGQGTNGHIPGGTLVSTPIIKNGDRVRLNPSYTDNYQLDGILNYDRQFGKHHITVLALYEQYERYTEGVAAEADGTFIGGLDNQNFTYGAQSTNQANGAINEYGREAFATRVNYNFADKYLLELAFRGDANTNFAPGHQWGYFPSGSIGWVASQEEFFKRAFKFVDYFKLRGSAGLLGNDNTSPFQYQQNYAFATGHAASFGSNTTGRGVNVEPSILLANANATWDSDLKTDLGFDAAFLNNRLTATVDGFFEHRYNLLTQLSASVPFVIGTKVPTENALSINNFGYEISVGWKDKIGKDWTYNFSPFLGWSDNKNIVIDQSAGLNGTFQDLNGKSSDQGVTGYKYIGIFRTQADVDAWLAKYPNYTEFGQPIKPGMPYYEDVRGPKNAAVPGGYDPIDGKITNDDATYLTHKQNNHYNIGLNFGGSFKTLTLNVTMGISTGGYQFVESSAFSPATATSNRPAFWADHWTPDNTNAKYPAPAWSTEYAVNSTFWLKSSTTFKVTNMNLSYGIPQSIINKLGIASAKVVFVAVNPINFYNPFSDYRGAGANYDTFPQIKSYSFGLNVGF